MGFRRAGGDNHPVDAMFPDEFFHQLLGILGAAEQVAAGIDHIGKGFRISFHILDIHDAGDIDAAVTDKNPDSRLLIRDIQFFRQFDAFGKRVAGFPQGCAGQAGGGAGFHYGAGDILGSLKDTAGIHTGSRGFNGRQRMRCREIVMIQFHVQPPGQIGNRFRNLEADGKHHHVKVFFLEFAAIIHIADLNLTGVENFVQRMDPRFDKANAGIFGPVVIFFIILAECPDIHIKNDAIQVSPGVFLGDHGILDGVHAAYG